MSMRRWLPAALVVGLAVLLNSCGSSTDAPSDVALVSLDLASTTLLVANTVTITATVQGKLGSVSDAVSWHSDAPNIADVSSTGLQTARVTAKSQGTTRITASAGGQSASATITVTNIPVSSVSIASRVDTVMVGTTKQLTAVAYDGSGGALTGRPIQWSSLNTSIATVDGTGTVTPLTLGVVKIVATSETKSDTAQVTVTPGAVTQITISPPSLSLYEGDTASFQVVLKDVANDVLSGRAVTWTSSDPTVAAVASSAANTAIGNIRGVAKGGPITVTATSEGKSTTGTVQVRIVPAKSVSMVPASLTLFVGGRGLVTATALDSSGNALPLRAIHWASGDTTIATVAAAGSTATLTGVKAGTASVTATTDEGTTGTTLVTVQNAVTHVLTVTLGFNEITSGGSVTSNPPGINCALAHTVSSGTCSSSFAAGTSVTLSAFPNPPVVYRLQNWAGACSGNGQCTVVMSADKGVTAIFDFAFYPVTVTITGSGTVRSTGGWLCSTSSCTFQEQYGAVLYDVIPAAGWKFTSWGGACSGTVTTCPLSISGPAAISATFQPAP